MENKKKKYILITSILLVILLIIGVSYAYWILTKEQTNENVVNSACLNIDIESESDDITLDKAYPILDSEGRKLKPYKFSVHNKCSDMATYQINLESLSTVLEANRLNPNYLKVKLNEVGQDGIEKVLGETSPTATTIENTYEAHKLMSGYLEANETKDFELRLWMHEKVTVENADSMNKEFKSKITVTSTYIHEEDVPPTSSLALSVCDDTITATATATPYKNKSISKYEYQIDEEDWQDGSETKEFTDQSVGEHTIKLRVTDNKGATNEVEQTINTTPEMVEIAGKQIQITTCKNGLYAVSHEDLEELSNDWSKIEYRYAGENPDNYVSFNNEIWRIIGLVNVKTESGVEQRIKIVRINGIEGQKDFGNYAWDRSNDLGDTNNWTTSKLKDMLNGIYFNEEIGKCYIGLNEASSTESICDFNSGTELPKGLNEIARSMIDEDVIWNIGGHTDAILTVKQFYEKERGNITYNGNPYLWSDVNDSDMYKGVGLIYPSDYGYATSGGSLKRKICFDKILYEWKNTEGGYQSECGEKDWLKPVNEYSLTLTSYTSRSSAYLVYSSGYVGRGNCYVAYGVWPTAYLIKSAKITSGEGTLEEPFNLDLQA